jgi:hypothetical protein
MEGGGGGEIEKTEQTELNWTDKIWKKNMGTFVLDLQKD